eukprot:XP_008656903.2 40S ribosomal protein S6 [Zea mays]
MWRDITTPATSWPLVGYVVVSIADNFVEPIISMRLKISEEMAIFNQWRARWPWRQLLHQARADAGGLGENDLPGLTDTEKPRMRGPKRASKIRKLFNLAKDDDVRKYVNTYRKTFTTKNGKKVSKAPKIQRLVTPLTLQRKRARIADKKKRIAKKKSEAAEYQKLLAQRLKEQRDRRSESLAKRRSKLSAAAKASAATSA